MKPYQMVFGTSEALKFNALLSHNTRTHQGNTEIMPSDLEPPPSHLSLQVSQTQSTRINSLMTFPRWVETCQRVAAAAIRRSKCSDLMDYPVLLLKPEQELDIVSLQMMHLRRHCALKSSLPYSTVTLSAFIWSLTTAAEPSMSSCWISRLFSFEFGCSAAVTLCSSLQNTPTPTPNLRTLSQLCFVYRKMQENPLHTDWPKYGTPWNLHMQACIICMEHQSFIKHREEQLTA